MRIIYGLSLLLFALVTWAAQDDPTTPNASDDTQSAVDNQATPAPNEPANPDTDQQKNTEVNTRLTYVTPDKAKQRMAEALRHLKLFQRENEIIEIQGTDGPFTGLYLEHNTTQPQGGVLILHDIAQHAHWPNTVSPIREYLPDYGWNTLSVFFEQYLKKALPVVIPHPFLNTDTPNNQETANTDNNATNTPPITEGDGTEPDESTDNTAPSETAINNTENTENAIDNQTQGQNETGDALDNIANSIDEVPDFKPVVTPEELSQPAIPIEDTFIEKMTQRVTESLNTLNDFGQYNLVVIANGYSANWAAKVLANRLENNASGYALILIDAKTSNYPKVELNEYLTKLNIPILDIITDVSNESTHGQKTRKGAMLRNQNMKYKQLYLPAIKPSLTDTQNILSRRIRGWLMTHAAGEEMTVKKGTTN